MGSRALRVGAAAILCALTLRLFASGLPGKLLSWLRLILPSLQGRFANMSYFLSGQWLFLFASGGGFLFASGG